MTQHISQSRRRLLLATSAIGACVTTGLFSPTASATPSSISAAVVSLFSNPSSAAKIGQRFLTEHPREAKLGQIIEKLSLTALDELDGRRLRTRLATASREDFVAGRTVQLDGWLLSHTDARRCALAALLEP